MAVTNIGGRDDLAATGVSSLQPNADSPSGSDTPSSLGEIATTLSQRYLQAKPYTSVGSRVLISLTNPHTIQSFDAAAAQSYIDDYRDTSSSSSTQRQELPPHIFELSQQAYLHMRQTRINQTIVFLGQSGSGKTLQRKLAVKYFSLIRGHSKRDTKLFQKIQSVDTVVEAFSHAKIAGSATANNNHSVQNGNASRVGTYYELQYDDQGRATGMNTLVYLLEKSRLTNTTTTAGRDGQQNFHVLYYLANGVTNPDDRRRFGLLPDSNINNGFAYLSSGSTATNTGGAAADADNDASKQFQNLVGAMSVVGLTSKVQTHIFQLLSVILNLSNLQFVDDDTQGTTNTTTVRNTQLLAHIAEQLGVNALSLEDTLTRKTQRLDRELYTAYLDSNRASDRRDELARVLYSLLFNWITEFINTKLSSPDSKFVNCIGLLDLPGFQLSPGPQAAQNFESLCVNYANECLYQFFLRKTLDDGIQEYQQEGLASVLGLTTEYREDTSRLDVFVGQKYGLFPTMDRQANEFNGKGPKRPTTSGRPRTATATIKGRKDTKKGSQKEFNTSLPPTEASRELLSAFTKYQDRYTENSTTMVFKPLNNSNSYGGGGGGGDFSINHYWGQVEYSVDDFFAKNIDPLSTDFITLFQNNSSSSFSSSSASAKYQKSSQGCRNRFVSGLFSVNSQLLLADQGSGKNSSSDEERDVNNGGVGTIHNKKPTNKILTNAQTLSVPKRKPSMYRKVVTKESSSSSYTKKVSCVVTQLYGSMNDLLESIDNSLNWFVLCLKPNITTSTTNSNWSSEKVDEISHLLEQQARKFKLDEIVYRKRICEYSASMTHRDFCKRYAMVFNRHGISVDLSKSLSNGDNDSGSGDGSGYSQKCKELAIKRGYLVSQFAVGVEKVFLSYSVWREIDDIIRAEERAKIAVTKSTATTGLLQPLPPNAAISSATSHGGAVVVGSGNEKELESRNTSFLSSSLALENVGGAGYGSNTNSYYYDGGNSVLQGSNANLIQDAQPFGRNSAAAAAAAGLGTISETYLDGSLPNPREAKMRAIANGQGRLEDTRSYYSDDDYYQDNLSMVGGENHDEFGGLFGNSSGLISRGGSRAQSLLNYPSTTTAAALGGGGGSGILEKSKIGYAQNASRVTRGTTDTTTNYNSNTLDGSGSKEFIQDMVAATEDNTEDDEKNGSDKLSKTRRIWLKVVMAMTFLVPTSLIQKWGNRKRKDEAIAWREKLALCLIIFWSCIFIIFWIAIFGSIICPHQNVYSLAELSDHNDPKDAYIAIRGEVFNIEGFNHVLSPDYKYISDPDRYYLGNDLSELFPLQLSFVCPGLDINPTFALQPKPSLYSAAYYHDHRYWRHPDGPAYNYYQNRLMRILRTGYSNGHIGYTPVDVAKAGRGDTNGKGIRYQFIVDDQVYDLTPYINSGGDGGVPYVVTPDDQNNTTNVDGMQFFDRDVIQLIKTKAGQDITREWNIMAKKHPKMMDNHKTCFRAAFYSGIVDNRKSTRCYVANYLLLAFSIIIVSLILIKFLASLQLGTRREPEDCENFVILNVPCYTEGEESLKKTIESLTSLKYDDKRKLIFIICDGMIMGSGNELPTPRIVLDLLGVDSEQEPEALSFVSLGDGRKQHNMGKVYSGLTEHNGHVVPYIVVVKCGTPDERDRPGNRGKRDSQILLMRFFNKVHFDLPMTPLELEMYHQIKNVIGVDPHLYEFVLMIDADTYVFPDSLIRLVSAMAHDVKTMGICGETQLSNAKKSWVTMMQVYEYYISHYMAKAFESLFGSVTCLPGCFSLYRLKTDEGKPLLISKQIIEDYSINRADTLHTKNLLHLGEDRYLTTLMLKHFPFFKNKFISSAQCRTNAPESWRILLSQRRRWINSTVHNLFELVFLPKLCGFCCFSMRFIVFIDLISTMVMPATVAYLAYLIYTLVMSDSNLPYVSLYLLAAIYGLQALVFLIRAQWQHIIWMIIYLIGIPLFSFVIPVYSFWHFDDFSWGKTRVIIGESGRKHVYMVEDDDDGDFDVSSIIPVRRWSEFEAQELMGEHLDSSRSFRDTDSVSQFSVGGHSAAGALAAARPGSAIGNYPRSMSQFFENTTTSIYMDNPPYPYNMGATNVMLYGQRNSSAPYDVSSVAATTGGGNDKVLAAGATSSPGTAAAAALHNQRMSLISPPFSAGASTTMSNNISPLTTSSLSPYTPLNQIPLPDPTAVTTTQSMLFNQSLVSLSSADNSVNSIPTGPNTNTGGWPSGATEKQVRDYIYELVKTADLMTITKKQVREQVMVKFGMEQDEVKRRRKMMNETIAEAVRSI
ncbi:hypothetical protein H4219_004006 [Mycoemilia scoparia]|uniref:chitin synthase n=1 Tax=Mycoemilia scoparia TaxID=417184 RepID=A0A9W7ZYP9_9FUNG|nr:hypothetical protein H4219_004006 [Mycoemilia scoparia]